MDGAYVTLGEAAELEGIGYDTMNKRVQREPGKFRVAMEQRKSGGRDQVMVAVSSLSKKARAAWKERERLKGLADAPDQEQEDKQGIEAPWYVDADIDWYMEAHKEEWYKAMELGNVIREFISFDEKGKTEHAEGFARERLGKGSRTLYRYVKAYLEAGAWAERLHKQDGGNYEFFRVLCLCRKPKEAGTFPSFTPQVRQAIKNIWYHPDFAANQGTKEMLYEKLEEIRAAMGWEKIPSYQSVVRYINYTMEPGRMKNAWYLASRGDIAYRNKVMVKGERNTKDLKVMQLVMGDEHTFDCFVAYRHPNGKISAIKPHLAAWIDIRSRMILGDVMCKDANADILKQSLLKLLYHDAGSVPQYIYIDNGKDYTAKEMTGHARNDRQRLMFDDATKGFYRSIGIEDYHRSLPYYAWTKAQIERFFRTVCNKFSRWFVSYTGTLTGSKTFAKVDKDINGMLARGELITLEEFYEVWSKWLREVYMERDHSGLKKQGEAFISPRGCFENAERYEKALPPKSYATLLMMKSEKRYVKNTGIQMGGLSYRSDELCAYIGSYVDIKYDPHDMGTVYVFKDGKQVCEAYAQELLTFASENGVEQKALKEHLTRQKKQYREDRKILEDANVPFDEINGQYAGFKDTVGGIDLMAGKKTGKGKGKIIAMPEDNTYRSGFRGKKPDVAEEENGYINRQAEEALKTLRAN